MTQQPQSSCLISYQPGSAGGGDGVRVAARSVHMLLCAFSAERKEPGMRRKLGVNRRAAGSHLLGRRGLPWDL